MSDPDWREFNHRVLRAYNIEELYPQIVNSLLSLRKVRKAANEKFINVSTAGNAIKLYSLYNYPAQMVADSGATD